MYTQWGGGGGGGGQGAFIFISEEDLSVFSSHPQSKLKMLHEQKYHSGRRMECLIQFLKNTDKKKNSNFRYFQKGWT